MLVCGKILNILLQIHEQLFVPDGTSQTIGFQSRSESYSKTTPGKIALAKANLLTHHHKAPHKNNLNLNNWLNIHSIQSQ